MSGPGTAVTRTAADHRKAIERRIEWQTTIGIPQAPEAQRGWIIAERNALRWALRVIGECPEIADRVAAEISAERRAKRAGR